MKTRIAIAEDNYFLMKALEEKLSYFLDCSVRLSALNGKELLAKLDQNPMVDLVLMDIEMPEMNGIEAAGIIKNKFPHIKIIMLTVFDNEENIFRSVKAGADGYLLKEATPELLHDAIHKTLKGGAVMTPIIASKALKLLRHPMKFKESNSEEINLSDREIDVLRQLSTGKSYTNIAEILSISPFTVRSHIENIYKKLRTHNKLETIEKARKNNLL